MSSVKFQGTSGDLFPFVKNDRLVMVGSKGSVKRDGSLPYREYMELRSMSRRPSPPYSRDDGQKLSNLQENSTSKRQNGSNKVPLEENNDSPRIIIRSGCAKFSRCRYLICRVAIIFMIILCVIFTSAMFPYPLHASCVVKWKFGDPCIYAMQKFRCQMLNWSSCVNCGPRGSRCLYTLKEPKLNESNVIRAVHLASNLRTVERIKIVFEELNKSCVATGESVSNEWFRLFDYGANYCNLHNLVTAIGFDENPKFLELTSNAVCTQYSMAVCE